MEPHLNPRPSENLSEYGTWPCYGPKHHDLIHGATMQPCRRDYPVSRYRRRRRRVFQHPASTRAASLEDGEALDRTIIENTVIGTAPLVPEIRLRLLRDDSSLWRSFTEQPAPADLPRPYWAFAWSGGQTLARYLLDHPELVKHGHVLDFGAGCGIAAIAAARAGAKSVTASDIDPLAVRAIAHNAELNTVQVETVQRDLIYAENPGWDVVLAGDIWYETRLARHGLSWLRKLAASGVLVLTGDPGRAFSPSQGMEALATYSCRSVPDLEHPALQTTSVFRVQTSARPGSSRVTHDPQLVQPNRLRG